MTKDAGIELDTKGVGSAALLYAVFGLGLSGMKVQANDLTCAKFTGPSLADPSNKEVYDSSAIDQIPDTDQGILFKKFITASQYARGWLIDLVACHQIKPLNSTNIENFFLALNVTRLSANMMLNTIRVAAAYMPE
ncbi:hypothetical protein QYM36_002385, partial [Artemia franciscana]